MLWDFGSLYQRRCGVFSHALSRQPHFTSLSLRRLQLRVAAQASRTSATLDVEASSITSCCARPVSFSERRCGVTVCLQSRRRQPVFHLSQVSSLGVTSALRVTDGSMVFVECIMVAQLGWRTVQVHVASLSVDLTWWPRRTTPMAPDFLPRYQSEASQSTVKVTKHSAATAGQLPLGTGGEFLIFHCVAFNREFPPTPILRGTPSQYKRRNSGSARVLSQCASGRTTSNSKHSNRFPVHSRSLHWFREDTSHSAELRSRRHLCNDRCRWSKQRLKP